MLGARQEQPETDSQVPAEPELVAMVERASTLVRLHPECFWFWHPQAKVRNFDDIRLVITHLREYGDRRAWREAQELQRCLLPYFKKSS